MKLIRIVQRNTSPDAQRTELMSSSDRYILLFELSCLRNKSTKDVSQANALTVDLFHLSILFDVGACHQFWVWQLILVIALV